jgi:ribose transport system permease protein
MPELTVEPEAGAALVTPLATRRESRHHKANRAYQVVVGFSILAVLAGFSIAKPHSFPTMITLQAVLANVAPVLLVALGLTVVLVVKEFDLSVGYVAGLCGTVAVIFVSTTRIGVPIPIAVFASLLVGAIVGCVNGFMVSYFKASSFIVTLATGTVICGVDTQLLGSNSIYDGIPSGYVSIAAGSHFGFSNQTYIAIAAAALVGVVLRHLTVGRYMYATGSNPEAARLSGIPVKPISLAAYAVAGALTGLAGVLVTSQAASASPNSGTGLLLPAYAAAFLGSSLWKPGQFTVVGTLLGALFLQVISTGLTMFSISGALVSIIQGAILLVAVLLALIGGEK